MADTDTASIFDLTEITSGNEYNLSFNSADIGYFAGYSAVGAFVITKIEFGW
jgi:hypothetical protein